jgi:diguanylate cyclase (GGDEF)-like protein
MNRPETWLAAGAFAPLLSYFLGRLNRWAGLAAGAGLAALSLAGLARADFPAAAFAVFLLWTAGALWHSFYTSSTAWAAPDRSRLEADLAAAAALEAELARLKEESRLAASGEKRGLALFSAVKLLSETVDPPVAGRQLGRHLSDYFGTGAVALYLEGDTPGQADLFAHGHASASLPGLAETLAAAGGFPAAPVLAGGAVLAPLAAPGAGAPMGLLVVRAAGPEALPAAARFAEELAFSLRRVQLFRQVERLSLTDGLTGLWRRSALDGKLEDELRRSAAFKTTAGLMIVDIDHFKRLNDNYGHQFGDIVLKRVAQLLREGVYETDFVGRYGGEEFGIVLPRADAAGLLRKAETIRQRIAAEPFQQGLDTVRLTVSIGIAHFPRDGATPRELVASADAALYAAKEGGRNRVVDAGGRR